MARAYAQLTPSNFALTMMGIDEPWLRHHDPVGVRISLPPFVAHVGVPAPPSLPTAGR